MQDKFAITRYEIQGTNQKLRVIGEFELCTFELPEFHCIGNYVQS